jgi:hypothetical protein
MLPVNLPGAGVQVLLSNQFLIPQNYLVNQRSWHIYHISNVFESAQTERKISQEKLYKIKKSTQS